jgi:hypothetical protein
LNVHNQKKLPRPKTSISERSSSKEVATAQKLITELSNSKEAATAQNVNF